MLPQEGRKGFQAIGMGRKLSNQAGSDVDAGGVSMLDGQSLDVGCLLLVKGVALGLRTDFTAVIGLALGLGLNALGAGGRGGSGLASGRSCGHGRTPRTR